MSSSGGEHYIRKDKALDLGFIFTKSPMKKTRAISLVPRSKLILSYEEGFFCELFERLITLTV